MTDQPHRISRDDTNREVADRDDTDRDDSGRDDTDRDDTDRDDSGRDDSGRDDSGRDDAPLAGGGHDPSRPAIAQAVESSALPDPSPRQSSARSGKRVSNHTVEVPGHVDMVGLLGTRDELLRVLERAFGSVDIHVRGNVVHLSGPVADVALVERTIDEMTEVLASGQHLSGDAVQRTIAMLQQANAERPADVLTLNVLSHRGRTIRPKTLNQKRYVDAIDTNTVVFGIGPAGTGKTYLAMAKAVQALQAKQVTRIILTRPAVEAGERLGFLPGTLTEKIDPYLRPLYDALHDMIDSDSIPRLMASGTIEVAPLAYMRGRSLNDAFIILDEAQNTTPEQMKMFLTRLGFGSKMVVTGDVTQVDLPGGTQSGLRIVRDILTGIEDVHFSTLTSTDVVRHRLVGDIVEAYGRWDAEQLAWQQSRARPTGQGRASSAPRSPDGGRPTRQANPREPHS